MTDTPVIPTPTPTPAPETTTTVTPPAPVETPTLAPVVAEQPVIQKTEQQVVKPAETVIAAELDRTAEKPVTESKEVVPSTTEEKKTTEGQSEEPASPPVYDAFKLPENVQLDEQGVKQFTDMLGELELKGKAEHALVQEFGQKAVDFHINKLKETAENLTKFYQTTWEKQKTDWKDQFLKDPEIGGNRWQTTVDSALNFIRTHGGTAEQQAEFRNVMETSGLGNHPAVIRLLANAGRVMKEGQPLAAQKPAPQPKSKTKTLYGS